MGDAVLNIPTYMLRSRKIDNVLDTSKQAKSKIKKQIKSIFKSALRPPPSMNLVEWADEYRMLPDNSAEAGKWKTSRVEAARAPMLSITNDEVQEVTVMSCIQFMKTELMLNAGLYFMHQEPSPIMYVAPKKETAEAWSKERLVKSVNATPVVSDIFSNNRRGEGNTITQKQFPGGQISIVSARNPSDLAMRACRIMLFDEIDKYPINVGSGEAGAGGEGDPIVVAWGRATTYGKRAKKVAACSPTVRNKSRIEQEYFKSNMSVFIQPCPHCGHEKTLIWSDVNIPRNKDDSFQHENAHILCKECGVAWTEGDRHKSIRKGFWVATKPGITWHHGYKVSSLASPFTPIVTLAKEFNDAQGNPQALKAFYNTRMAETWQEMGEQPDYERLYERRENYKTCIIPDGGLILTVGIDVQKDYLVYEVVAWGRRRESWSVDKGVIDGNIEDDSTKEALAQFLDTTYENKSGVHVPIMKAAIDSGYMANEVYSFVRSYGSDRVVAVKGEKDGNLATPLGTPRPVDVNIDGKRFSRGIMLWSVGSSVIKEQIYRWLNLKKPTDEDLKESGNRYPSGYCHFPQYDEEFFKQITAEQYMMTVDNRGFQRFAWEKLRKDNHYLDCRVYARAATCMLQIDRMMEGDWIQYEEKYHPGRSETSSAPQVELQSNSVKPKPKQQPRKKNGWIKRR